MKGNPKTLALLGYLYVCCLVLYPTKIETIMKNFQEEIALSNNDTMHCSNI